MKINRFILLFFAVLLIVNCTRNKDNEKINDDVTIIVQKDLIPRIDENIVSDVDWQIIDGFLFNYEGTILSYRGHDTDVVIPYILDDIPIIAIESFSFKSKGLTSVTIPDTVTSIREWAFQDNPMTYVIIPDSVTTIGESAFHSNKLLSCVIIGANVTLEGQLDGNISNYSSNFADFYNTNGKAAGTYVLDKVVRDKGVWKIAKIAQNENGFLMSGDGTVVAYIGLDRDVIIPAQISDIEVTAIGNYAFTSKGLTSVSIPDTVISIGNSAFADNELSSIIIPASVTTIDEEAFQQNKLTNVIIPDSITTINNSVFSVNQLTDIVIPDSITSIGYYAFYSNEFKSVVIPKNVNLISDRAFSFNMQLTSVTISSSNTIIGDGAFGTNDSRASLTVPSGDSFNRFYNLNEMKSGTYVYRDGRWWME